MTVTLLSGGCSYAYGYGLENRNDRYSYIIAKQRGWELVDVSGGAFANESIATAVISGINKLLNNGKTPDTIVVVVGWTSQPRMEYFDTARNKIMTMLTVPPDHYVHQPLQNVSGYDRAEIAAAMWHSGYGYYKYLHAFNYVDVFCRLHGIKIIHVQNLDIFPVKMPDEDRLHTEIKTNELITNALDSVANARLKHLLKQKTFASVARNMKDMDDTNHPRAASHFEWAHYIEGMIG